MATKTKPRVETHSMGVTVGELRRLVNREGSRPAKAGFKALVAELEWDESYGDNDVVVPMHVVCELEPLLREKVPGLGMANPGFLCEAIYYLAPHNSQINTDLSIMVDTLRPLMRAHRSREHIVGVLKKMKRKFEVT